MIAAGQQPRMNGPAVAGTPPCPRTIRYEDLPEIVGQEIGCSDWLAVDQQRIDGFADLTEDHQWIHVDRERAEQENGGTIAHGFLMLAMIPALTLPLLQVEGVRQILNYGVDRLRFLDPVRNGDRVRARSHAVAAEQRASGTLLRSLVLLEKQGTDRPALSVESLMLMVPIADRAGSAGR